MRKYFITVKNELKLRLSVLYNLSTLQNMNRNLRYLFVLLFLSSLALYGCGGKGNSNGGVQLSSANRVVTHLLNEAERLNPQNSTGADETYMEEEIFERLLRIDPVTMKMDVPWLAESMPI